MNCAELENLLCDYLDRTLPAAARAAAEEHLAQCPACSALARDTAAAVSFIETAAPVEPPPELVTRILFELRSGKHPVAERRRGLRGLLGPLFQPILQPRFAMGMAMTILSFSMLGRFAGMEIRQLKPADLNPVKVWQAVDNRLHRAWERSVKFYESLRLVYEIQTRVKQLAPAEGEDRQPPKPEAKPPAPGASPQSGGPTRDSGANTTTKSREAERQ